MKIFNPLGYLIVNKKLQPFKRARGYRVKIHNKTCNTVKSNAENNKNENKSMLLHYIELAFGTNVSILSRK